MEENKNIYCCENKKLGKITVEYVEDLELNKLKKLNFVIGDQRFFAPMQIVDNRGIKSAWFFQRQYGITALTKTELNLIKKASLELLKQNQTMPMHQLKILEAVATQTEIIKNLKNPELTTKQRSNLKAKLRIADKFISEYSSYLKKHEMAL